MRIAQSSLLAILLLVGAALVMGIAMYSYFISISTSYRADIERINVLNYESVNQIARVIAIDSLNRYVWIYLKRLDNAPRPFFIAIDNGSIYLSGGYIYIYNPSADSNGVLCDEPGECTPAPCIAFSNPMDIYAYSDKGVVSYKTYSSMDGYPSISSKSPMYICIISIGRDFSILRIWYGYTYMLRIHMITYIDNRPYILYTYGIPLS